MIASPWPVRPLSEIVELQRGHDLPSSQRVLGNVPIIGSFGVTGFHDRSLYAGPGVAIGRSGASIGAATFVDLDFWPLNTCLFVRDFKGNDPRWVYRMLDQIDFAGFNSGSAQPSLNRNFLRSIPVRVPSLEEQRAIAEVLGALDDKIAANERVNGASEALAVALVESAPRATRVSELATQSTQSVSPNGFDERVAHFSLPSFDDGGRPDLAAPSSIKSNKFLIERPAVLISKLNPRIPRVWDVVQMPDQMALASTEFVVLHPTGLSTTALWGALRQSSVTAVLGGKVAGTSGSHQRVRPAEILQLQVPDPRTLEPRVLQRVDSLGGSIHAVRVESVRLAATRDELLPLLMSGRLHVKDAEKVVAEVV
ncbi:MAG: restriction endonuclease subunit S [Micropruina glycogenica]